MLLLLPASTRLLALSRRHTAVPEPSFLHSMHPLRPSHLAAVCATREHRRLRAVNRPRRLPPALGLWCRAPPKHFQHPPLLRVLLLLLLLPPDSLSNPPALHSRCHHRIGDLRRSSIVAVLDHCYRYFCWSPPVEAPAAGAVQPFFSKPNLRLRRRWRRKIVFQRQRCVHSYSVDNLSSLTCVAVELSPVPIPVLSAE